MPNKKNAELAAAMARKGLTVRELASRAEVNRATVSRILNRKAKPRPLTAKALAEVLETPVEDLGFDNHKPLD